MYNGVGIVTPRGSGTSGFVQKNAATVRHKVDHGEARRKEEARKAVVLPKDPELIEHERKREVELKVQLWVRENDIRTKHDKAKAAELIRQKRKEVELELAGGSNDEKRDDNSRSKKRQKE
jgi:serine/arginine repetitive matrix protein 2